MSFDISRRRFLKIATAVAGAFLLPDFLRAPDDNLGTVGHAHSQRHFWVSLDPEVGDDGNDGLDPSRPMLTMQAAMNACKNSRQDVVFVMPYDARHAS